MINSFFSFSFGCRVNEAEREELDRKLIEAGLRLNEAEPDLYVVNTCAVTQKAEREAKQHIYQIRKKNPKAKIVITGCAATHWQKDNSQNQLPIDLLVDNINKEFLAKIILRRFSRQATSNFQGQNKSTVKDKFINSGRFLIKMQDGCQRFCTFCIVPYLRGLPKSYSIKEIIAKINRLKGKANEVILTAINTEAFGYKTGERFVDLIDSLVKKTNIPRISFGSIHPWSINDEFFSLYRQILFKKRLVNFFHIPLQSGSNKILELMKRGYKREEMMQKLEILTRINPFALIGTDIIVGFLGESDRDFTETYNFLEKAPINKFHVFRFSKREKTAAFYLAKRIEEPSFQTKIKRSKALHKLSQYKYHRFLRKFINYSCEALFLEKRIDDYVQALLDNQLPVLVRTAKKLTGQIKNIKVTDYKKGQLFGKIV